MQTIEEYLKGEFRQEKSRLKDIYDTLVEIARFFCQSYENEYDRWDYEFPSQPRDQKYSFSTQAMCALALTRLTAAAFWQERNDKEQAVREAIKHKRDNCVQELCTKLNQNAQQGGKVWESSTYGEEDPLTATWIVELFSDEPSSLNRMVRKKLQDTIHTALNGKFDRIIHAENRAGAHAFPVYRLVLLVVKNIQRHASKWKMAEEKWQPLLSTAGYWFEQELHRQLSHHHFNDFRFDAPELIYSLAGALQTNRLHREDPLIREVMKVIRATQEQRSVYWRPYRPFVVRPQGLALMPLSVEVADALFDIWKVTGHFDQLKESLTNYYEWLMTQKIEKRIDKDSNVINVIGWRSENAFGPPEVERIHTWTTSRVAMFLLNYSRVLDLALQSDLLSHSGLSFKDTEELTLDWKDIQPMDRGRKNEDVDERIMPMIEKYFINPHESILREGKGLSPNGSFSMFLYGPPGTSKTSLAEGLAKKLGLKLVTITVSDFILSGVQAVEQRAKVIFDILSELKNVVILFDEIDRLITDRESERYFQQGDILQLMTPSMLTKINDLRRKKKLIFAISTNYFERIDKAIRRPGRIDQHFLLTPFDQKSRVEVLSNFICKCKDLGEKGKDWNLLPKYEKWLGKIAKRAPLLVFEELKRVFERSMSGVGKGDIEVLLSNLDSEIQQVKPSISIGSYDRRLADKYYSEKPYREYFFLCFLLAEVNQANKKVKASFRKWWIKWTKENARELRGLTSDSWVQEQLRKLGVAADKNQPRGEGRKSHT